MKFALTSDVHLEFGRFDIRNTENADLLILAGDICVARDFKLDDTANQRMYREFFEQASSEFGKVIYIMGNHEHYNGDYAKSERILRDEMSNYPNVHFLHNEYVDLCGQRFFGGTMWTSLNKENPRTILHVKGCMNDFNLIDNSNKMVSYRVPDYTGMGTTAEEFHSTRLSDGKPMQVKMKFKEKIGKLTPEDTIEEHNDFMTKLDAAVKGTDGPVFVISHHLPTFESVPMEYRRMTETNYAYASDLSEFILDNNHKIKYWVHGHTHDNCDYMVGDTRVICNPRGYYGYETRVKHYELQYFEC